MYINIIAMVSYALLDSSLPHTVSNHAVATKKHFKNNSF